MQTLAYLLPVLTMALQKAEAEFEELAKKGKAHTAGVSHPALSSKAYHVRNCVPLLRFVRDYHMR